MDGRRELEIAVGFVLDQVRAGRLLFDVLDALLVVAVTQANIVGVLRDPKLQNAYAAYEAPPPDDLRRPISVHALAVSLGLPFETTRRRVRRLARTGAVRLSPDGLWTPSSGVFSSVHRATLEAAYGRLCALHAKLLWTDPPPPPARDGGWPLRAAARLSGEYLLRLVERLGPLLGDALDVVVWLGVVRANVDSGRGGLAPVRAGALAKALSLPTETVRRRTRSLLASGLLAELPGGLVAPVELWERPGFDAFLTRHAGDLRRMYARLAQLEQPGSLGDAGRAAA